MGGELVSEPSGEEYPPAPARRTDVVVAMARMEAKLDVALAQYQARLDEHGRSIAENKAAIARVETRVGSVEQKQAAADALEKVKPPPITTAGFISVGVSVLLAVLYLIEKFGA